MKKIDISTDKYPNKYALVDDIDFDRLSPYKWYLTKGGYAARNLPRKNGIGGGIQYMHREILNNPDYAIDHANLNKLDNRRNNLRLANKQSNAANFQGRALSGYKGVTFHKETSKWRARIMVNCKQISLGLYDTPELAHIAYSNAAEKYFGEFSRTDMRQHCSFAEQAENCGAN